MGFSELLELTAKQFKKKNPDSELEFKTAAKEELPTGLVVNNPLFEFILDRRFLAYGRFYLIYGKKGCAKTSLFYDLVKLFHRNNGDAIWIETENAIDLDYAKKQGVDLNKVSVLHPDSFEEALTLGEMFIRNMPKAYPDGDTPVLIALDSIAGAALEYESDDKHTISDTMPGTHARFLSRWLREMVKPIANEKCMFLLLNQLKSKIGGFGFSEDSFDALIGGEAQFFHSSYHWKMVREKELVAIDSAGAERKVGSRHKIQCKRNKLGREGKNQDISVDLYIDGGIDWWTPLVRKLGEEYPTLMKKSGGHYRWAIENTHYVDKNPETEKLEEKIIDTEQSYREGEMAVILMKSPEACEHIRTAFGIPGLPPEEKVQEVEKEKKKKRGRPAKQEEAEPTTKTMNLMEKI